MVRNLKIPPSFAALALLGTLLLFGIPISLSVWKGHRHGSTSFQFVGPETCSECHEEQAESWAKTRMANSFDVLRVGVKAKEKKVAGLDPLKDYTHDEECLPCHTTGYRQVGGFISIEETPHMAGVTCEACHGAGGRYAGSVMDSNEPTFNTEEARDAGLIYPPTTRVCRGCHNEDSPFIKMGYQFDYEKRVSAGTHQHFELKYDHGLVRKDDAPSQAAAPAR